MNQSLIKIDDNHGITKDDKGKLKVISKENNLPDFEEILSKENELEQAQIMLNIAKVDLLRNNSYSAMRKYANILFTSCSLGLAVLLSTVIPKLAALAVAITCFVTTKFIIVVPLGTKKANKEEKIKIQSSIDNLKIEIEQLQHELDNLKVKSNYKESDLNEKTLPINDGQHLKYITLLDDNNNIIENKNKPKVRSRVQDN